MAIPRVAPPRVFPVAGHAPKPPTGGPADAHRQTSFVLGADAELVVEGLTLEGAVAQAATGARLRTQQLASALGLWSRAWLCRLEALHALEGGNYAAAVTLIRSATDFQAAQIYLLRQGAAEWLMWLEQGGIALAPEEHATEYRLHAFRAAEVLAAHPILGPLYRMVMDLSMPHFGATLMLAGSESTPGRVAITFGDRDFHLGLAELCLGWLLQLHVAQAHTLVEHAEVFGVTTPAALEDMARQSAAAAARDGRCTMEAVEREGIKRYLVHNWRRRPGSASSKLLL
ncbi:MAG: hypothetical protein HS107_08690 [Thermoflexaceae bacterium]|nr:hypothetical protein [Thermoflexaceae bacterium]